MYARIKINKLSSAAEYPMHIDARLKNNNNNIRKCNIVSNINCIIVRE